MKTQNFLATVRLMTYTIILGLFVFSANVYAGDNDDITGGGKNDETTSQVESIELEQWMFNKEYFKLTQPQNISENHSLENRMIEGNFELKNSSADERIQLEDWMLKRSNFRITGNNSLESWMMNRNCFITEEERDFQAIKDWMLNHDFFKI